MTEPLDVELLIEDEGWRAAGPALFDRLTGALQAAAQAEGASGAVCALLTGDAEMAELNGRFRGKPKPTNVLSFPAAEGPGAPGEALGRAALGDLALGYGVVAQEASEQGKLLIDHACHLAVHGFLHLLGYDHERDDEAERMEARERVILEGLGVADPYADRGAS